MIAWSSQLWSHCLFQGATVYYVLSHCALIRAEFFISKTPFYGRHRKQINARQNKVIARLYKVGPDGLKGRLRAQNCISIARTARATAMRDLQYLVERDALT